ncbi:MAG: 2OG-Fe(II) oxygenase [Alphaproteobacteria bacterium]
MILGESVVQAEKNCRASALSLARTGSSQERLSMSLLDLYRFVHAPLTKTPFPFLVVPQFLKPEALAPVVADFPPIADPGLLPLSALNYGPSFAALIEEIRSGDLTAAFSEKFEIDLSHRPLMITVRGRCQAKDGRIHTDTESKLVTALLYLNGPWRSEGGRLRFLRGPDDLENALAEVPPDGGTLAAFRRTACSHHGHRPYVGERRYIMFNWMTDERACRRELLRHRASALVKRVLHGFS